MMGWRAAISRRCVWIVLLCCSTLSLAQPQAHGLRDSNAEQALPGTASLRVVTLAPSLTELVYATGAGASLVGVSAYSDFPEAARWLPQVADAASISWESLLALKPDLVLAWKGGTRQSDIARLNSLGLNVVVIEIKRLDDVSRSLRSIGKLVGHTDHAELTAREFERQLSVLRRSHQRKTKVKVFFEISAQPLMTVNRDHVISELIELCGGTNTFADSPTLVGEPSREELLKRSPDAILYGKTLTGKTRADASAYEGLAAAAHGRVYAITADYVFRPGPRLLWAAEEICASLDRSRISANEQIAR